MADRNLKIAFIGLGLMGVEFTKRFIALGYEVTGHDVDLAKVDGDRRGGRRAGEWCDGGGS
jgi:3-hydroxyisobutyrate dehydrogenase-like beta-hydroxyacid dehydrogenase